MSANSRSTRKSQTVGAISRGSSKAPSVMSVRTEETADARASVMAHYQKVAQEAKADREANAPNSDVWWAGAVKDERLDEAVRLADEMSAELERQQLAEAARQQAERDAAEAEAKRVAEKQRREAELERQRLEE